MEWSVLFFLNSVLLGVGLAMDAFSVSLALMPMAGWICVHTIIQYFRAFEKFIPWIALVLLCFIGGKMVLEGIKSDNEEIDRQKIGVAALFVQGVATSIDALIICMAGLVIGKKFGTKFSNRAAIFGGVILIVIGLKIFIKGVF